MNQIKFIYLFTLLSSFYFSAIAGSAVAGSVLPENNSNIKNAPQSKDNQNPNQIQQIEPNDTKTNFFAQNRDLILKFIKQPRFTKPSIKCFFRHTFNNPYYADKYLPFNMSHILTFSSFASQTAKPREYLSNVISIFKQKFFFSTLINGYEFEEFFGHYIEILSRYFDQKAEKAERISKIKERLYQLLYDDFDKLKANPEKILDETAASIDLIANNINNKSQDDIDLSIYDLQNAVFSFLQSCLSKLIWSPKGNPITIWESIKAVSSMLEECLKKQILRDRKHLNQLFWCQIARFSYLIEAWGHILPESFYNNILEEINNKSFSLWALKENDPLILSKFRHLNYVLNQGNMRSKLHKNTGSLKPISPD